jgi:valyl-tRNA synthetase
MIDKTFTPGEVEARLYDAWEKSGAFSAHPPAAKPYCIMMPPPNVTGSLHMGHALTFTLQDVLIRYRRALGYDALWQPGTDHAGIATQMVVERQLAEQQSNRHALGREKFIERVWEWKAESGGAITTQLRRLGASPDWARERFTLDEGLSKAVTKVFVELHAKGLIYRDKRLVNWDPKLHTAISDLEVEQRPVKGHLWYLRYPIEGSDEHIVVATTRPETMLGDTGVAVHPEDDRYKHLIGKNVVLPLVGRLIPIVGDEYSDPEKGSGAVKITPAHDFNDFEVGKRHGLSAINIFDRNAALDETAPERFRGLDRFEARKKIVAELEELGLVEKIEPHANTVPYGDRSDVAIEPWLTDQWYVDAATLAKPAIEAVEQGKTQFVPKQWEATYFEWMRNIQPWCVSRQIWWGHQIPAWFGPDGHIFVALDEQAATEQAVRHYGKPVALIRDPDVLDTWFSSALWPFSTLGWPDKTPELERYYPTDVLVTGFDIIFFWVARMMMMGLEFMGEVPFRTVYIHALVRDERGQKMSKSKGNIIDPLVLIDRYGADALRFTMAALAAPGRDVRLAEARVEGYRNFGTKLWNAARYAEMNGAAFDPDFDPAGNKLSVNQWIVELLRELELNVNAEMKQYRFDLMARLLYDFVWGDFCDWYLEFTKPILLGTELGAKLETQNTIAWLLRQIVQRLHPISPFLTEELWAQLNLRRPADPAWLAETRFDDLSRLPANRAALQELQWVVEIIRSARGVRNELNVPGGAEIDAVLADADAVAQGWLANHLDAIKRMARLKSLTIGSSLAGGAVPIPLTNGTVFLELAGIIDFAAERARLQKEIERLAKDIQKFDAKLANADFRAKADPEVIEETEERRAEAEAARVRLAEAVGYLSA